MRVFTSSKIDEWSPIFIRVSLGVIYLWFGVLKFIPEQSPAEIIARKTLDFLAFGGIPQEVSFGILALTETALGALLIFNLWSRVILVIVLCHIVMTFSPLVLFPDDVFAGFMVPTLLGQYIFKNLVLLSSLLVINKKICEADPVSPVRREMGSSNISVE